MISKIIKKISILLGIKKRYIFKTKEVMVLNDDGVPVDSYIERIEYDLLLNTETRF
jgi:hypothetical protein